MAEVSDFAQSFVDASLRGEATEAAAAFASLMTDKIRPLVAGVQLDVHQTFAQRPFGDVDAYSAE